MHYQDFKGSIQEISKTKYMLKGNYEILSTDEIHVTELPVGLWTETFKEHLESLMDCKDTKTKNRWYEVSKPKPRMYMPHFVLF